MKKQALTPEQLQMNQLFNATCNELYSMTPEELNKVLPNDEARAKAYNTILAIAQSKFKSLNTNSNTQEQTMKSSTPSTPSTSKIYKAKIFTASATSFVLGDIHLLLQTAADLTAHTEGYIVNKLIGTDIQEVKQARYAKTEETQDKVIASAKSMFAKAKGMASARPGGALEPTINVTND